MQFTSARFALFIDGQNTYSATRALGFHIDYKRLLEEFNSRGSVLRAFYYTVLSDDHEFQVLRPLVDWLEYNGYTTVTKPVKEFVETACRPRFSGNMDVDLTVNAMELSERVDEVVLFSGDGNLRPLVRALQRRGVRVTVVSTIAVQPAMIADELRRQSDQFIDLVELQPKICCSTRERSNIEIVARRAILPCRSVDTQAEPASARK